MQVRAQLKGIQSSNNEEMQMLMEDPYLPFQLLLQEEAHGRRLLMLEEMIQEVSFHPASTFILTIPTCVHSADPTHGYCMNESAYKSILTC